MRLHAIDSLFAEFNMYLTDIRGFTAEDGVRLYRFEKADTESIASFLADERIRPALFTLCGGDLVVGVRGEEAEAADAARKTPRLCKYTIHGMGLCGDKGLTLHFARFCTKYGVSPRFVSLSDMALTFFAEAEARERILDGLAEYFPIWA